MSKKSYYIYSNLNHAVGKDQDNLVIYDGFKNEYMPFNGNLFSQLSALDPEIVEVCVSKDAELTIQVALEYLKHQTFSMLLELLDHKLTKEYRNELSQIVESELKSHFHIIPFIENRLVSTLLPKSFSFESALSCISSNTYWVKVILEKSSSRTRLFARFITAFKLNFPLSRPDWSRLNRDFTDSGIFLNFIFALETRSLEHYELTVGKAIEIAKCAEIDLSSDGFSVLAADLQQSYKLALKNSNIKRQAYNLYGSLPSFSIHLNRSAPKKIRELECVNDSINYYLQDQRYQQLTELLNEGLLNHFKSDWLYFAKALSLYRLELNDLAILNVIKALELNEREVKILHLFGLATFKMGKYPEAYSIFDYLVSIETEESVFYLDRGACLNMMGDHEQAVEDFKRALEINPKDANGYFNLGNSYARREYYQQAIDCYSRAINLWPDDNQYLYSRALAYYFHNRYEDAFVDFIASFKIRNNRTQHFRNAFTRLLQDKNFAEKLMQYTDEADLNLLMPGSLIKRTH